MCKSQRCRGYCQRKVQSSLFCSLVRPGDGHVLLPPSGGHKGHVEAEDEREGDVIDEGIAVEGDLLEHSVTK